MKEVAPVLLLIFNRPDSTRKVFERIREVKPRQLFIAADGPRDGNQLDAIKSSETRRIVENVDWECDVKTLFREHNLGCGRAVSEAITWFFLRVEKGIILEDDCLPESSFFHFASEMLVKYADEQKILHISGLNLQRGVVRGDHSYYFSKYPSIWGWATWSDRWNFYDFFVSDWPMEKKNIQHYLNTDKFEWYYHRMNFTNSHLNKVNTWDYQWVYQALKRQKLSIVPNVNLIKNIGVGVDATHTDSTSIQHFLDTEELSFPLDHPENITADIAADHFLSTEKFSPKGRYFKTKNSLKEKLKNSLGL